MIGIKTADGNLIPILEDKESIKKRLVLTTVKDDQPTVHIDLYHGKGDQMEQAKHIGRLKIENVPLSKQGDPDIELFLGMDVDGNLISKARIDSPNTEEQSLILRLDEPSSEELELEDFQLKSDSVEEIPEKTPNGSKELHFHKKKHNYLLLIIAAIVAGVAILALALMLVFRTPPPPAPTVEIPKAPAPPVEAPLVQKPEVKVVPAAPIPVEPAAPIPENIGVWYWTVPGDNLWNLARSFYRNPLLYRKIAEENEIRNPDLIFQDYRLFIPDVETGKR